MSKFKVGDKIERTSMPQRWAPLGFITTVEVGYTYTDADGVSRVLINSNDWSLATEGPVRTVTRREVVGGVYGDVGVSVHPDGEIQIEMRMLTKDAKRVLSAAMNLSQIAEALDYNEARK